MKEREWGDQKDYTYRTRGKKAAESAGSFDIDAIRSVAVKLGDPLRF